MHVPPSRVSRPDVATVCIPRELHPSRLPRLRTDWQPHMSAHEPQPRPVEGGVNAVPSPPLALSMKLLLEFRSIS